MLTLLGNEIPIPSWLAGVNPVLLSFIANTLGWLGVGLVLYLLLTYVFRWITRRIPGDADDVILGVVRKPAVVIAVLLGIVNDLEILPIPAELLAFLKLAGNTVLISLAAYIVHRVIHDVALYYGELRARRDEPRPDDWILPIARLVSPIVLVVVVALIVLPAWGLDIGAVLAGAGLTGLVLGLALQDSVGNIFAGVGLLTDAPFALGDLIVLPSGAAADQIVRVDRIGLRTTEVYHIEQHASIFVPNKDLASMQIKNITKPTVDLKVSLPIGVSYAVDYRKAERLIREVCDAHPNVLADYDEMPKKLEAMRRSYVDFSRAEDDPAKDDSGIMVRKLTSEHGLHTALKALHARLEELTHSVMLKEVGGFTKQEIAELKRETTRVDADIDTAIQAMNAWSALRDPHISAHEQRMEITRWSTLNARLTERWTTLKKTLEKPPRDSETRIDDAVQVFSAWVRERYKPIPDHWKNPHVSFKAFGASSVDIAVEFYIDDIRLEHYYRRSRVLTEIGIGIFNVFRREGIEIPFPQTDVWFRDKPVNVAITRARP